jgi:DNA gyrase subunit A
MRYTEARLAPIAREMLRDLDSETVDFGPELRRLAARAARPAARFPNLLVNGSAGIAVGMATNIPPHNLEEVIDAVVAYIDDPEIDVDGLMRHVRGPDFPTGGIIHGLEGIRSAYETGRGRVRVRAKVGVEDIGRGKEALIVTELPFQVKKGGEGGLIQKIADLVNDKKIPEISDIRDETDRRGMRLVIELKRDVLPQVVLNKLYKHTAMQSTFGVNMVALVDGVPKLLPLLRIIKAYVEHQREVVVRRSKFELRQLEARVHVLEGLLIALDNLDAIIELIRASRTARPRASSSSSASRSRRSRPRRSCSCACRSSRRSSRPRSSRSTPTRSSGSRSCARCSATRPRCSRSSRRSSARSARPTATCGARAWRARRTSSTSRT